MPAKKKEAVARREEQVRPLTDVITSLDSVRAYRRRSSQNLDEKFSRLGGMGYSELRKLWWDIEDDVREIVEMPMKVPGVTPLIRLNFFLRIIGRAFLIVLVLILASRLVPIWRPVLGDLFGDRMWLLMVVAIGGIVGINGEIVVDYIIRRRIVKFEAGTEDRYKKHVDKVRHATQAVINQLVREVRQGHRDPNDFQFFLFFDDYEGIEIVREKTPRSMGVFKRRFKVYTAIPKVV